MGNMINKTYKKLASIILVSLLVFTFLPLLNPAFATINETFNFQAKLTNVNGTNVTDGTYNFRFSIYNASSAGDCLWTAKGTIPGTGACTFAAGSPGTDLVALTVTNGLLNTQLGTTAGSLRSFEDGAASLAQFSNNSLYLDIQIYNGSSWETFGSRKLLEAVPYAFRSKYSDNAGTSTNVPISGLTLAGANNSINNGNYNQTWNWALTSASQTGLLLSENTASVSSGTPSILGVNTIASSTAIPIYVQNIGGALSFRVDDQGSETSPFVIDASGKVGIGTDTPSAFLHVKSAGGVNSGINLEATSAASYGVIDFNTASGLAGQFLATGASFSNGIFTGDQIALASYINTGSTTLVAGGTSGYINFATGGYTAGNERMRIIANGNVGIGDTTPAALFTVGNTDLFQVNSSGQIAAAAGIVSSGTIQFSALTSNGALYTSGGNGTLTTTAPTSGALGYWSRTSTTLSPTTANDILSITGNSGDIFTLTSSATGASNKALNVSQTGATTGTDYGGYFSNTGAATTNVGLYSTATGATNNYSAIFDSGSVGIGTTGPTARLSVAPVTTTNGRTIDAGASQSGGGDTFSIYNPISLTITDVTSSVYGLYNTGSSSTVGAGGAPITRLIGVNNVFTASATGVPGSYDSRTIGMYTDLTTTGSRNPVGYGNYFVTNSSSSSGTQYVSYADMSAGTTTKWGLYFTGEANNYLSGKLGIGDTTPASALTVGSGDLFQVNSSGQIAAAAGIVSSGTIQFSTLTSNGALYTSGGNGTLTTTAPTSGALGYWSRSGTTLSPATANDVISISGNTSDIIYATSSSNSAGNKVLNVWQSGATSGTDYAGYFYNSGGSTTNVAIYAASAFSGGNDYAIITNGGNVGIGDISPTALLTVGNGDLFQVNSSGQITSAAGIISSGTIQFSALTSNGALYTSGGNGTLTTTAPTSGALGYWSRSSTTLSPTTANDILSITGNSGDIFTLTSSATGASNKGLTVSQTGATTGTDYAGYFSNTGAATTNVGLYASASGATNNYGLIVPSGFVGVGTSTPQNPFDIVRGTAGSMNKGTYESASFEYDGDNKVGIYTNTAFGSGASLVFGNTGTTDVNGYYPGFETQFVGASAIASNYMRYNFIERNAAGTVLAATTDILNITGDGKVGIGDVTPVSTFTVGSGDKFQIDSNGNIVKINNVTTSFPGSQGGVDTYLKNNGSGTLTWASVSSSSAISGLTLATGTNTIDNTLYAQTWNWSTLTTENALTFSSNGISTGNLLSLSSTSTALTSSSLLNILATGNPAASWTGALAKIEYTTSTDVDINGDALRIGITGAGAGQGTALNITSAQTGTNALAFRVNDDGTYTDSTPFIVDKGGFVGIGTTTPTAQLDVRDTNGGALRASKDASTYQTFAIGSDGIGYIYNSGGLQRVSGPVNTQKMLYYTDYAGSWNNTNSLGVYNDESFQLTQANNLAGNDPYVKINSTGFLDLSYDSNNDGTEKLSILNNNAIIAIFDENGRFGIGDTTPAALFTVGNTDLFQVNSSGQIAAAAGITSSGTVTFSGLSAMGAIVSTTGGALTSVTGASTNYLRHNGTTWVASTIQSGDIPSLSTLYIQNQYASAQTGDIWISGNLKLGSTAGQGLVFTPGGGVLTVGGMSQNGRLSLLDSSAVEKVSITSSTSASFINGALVVANSSCGLAYAGFCVSKSVTSTNTSIAAIDTTATLDNQGVQGLYSKAVSGAANTNVGYSLVASRGDVSNTQADTSVNTINIYGGYFLSTQTPSVDAGTRNGYALYAAATGNSNGTSTAYGLYTTAAGGDTNWAVYADNGNSYFKNSVGIGDTTPTSALTVGNGDLFQVNTSGNIVKINNITTSFPGSQGGANTVFVNDGSGNLSWATALTGVTIPISKLAVAAGTNTIDNTLHAQTWDWSTLSTQNALTLTGNGISTGNLLSLTSTSTALTSSSLLRILATGNPAASWTGALAKIEYTTSTDVDINGDALRIGITGAGTGQGTALNITTAQTGTNALAFRVNDDGTYTDSTPFIIDKAGNLLLGNTAHTIAAAPYAWSDPFSLGTTGDAFIANKLGVEGYVYSDKGFVFGGGSTAYTSNTSAFQFEGFAGAITTVGAVSGLRIDQSGVDGLGTFTGTYMNLTSSSNTGAKVYGHYVGDYIGERGQMWGYYADFDIGGGSFGGTTIWQPFYGATKANGTTTGQVAQFVLNNASTGGNQYIALIDNGDNTGTTEAGILLRNSDTNTAMTYGIQFVNSGGGFTTGIDMANSTIENIGNAGTDFNTSGGLTIANGLTLTTGALNLTGTSGSIALTGTLNITGSSKFAGNTLITSGVNGIGDQESMIPNTGFEINDDATTTVGDSWTAQSQSGAGGTYAITTTSIQGTNAQSMTPFSNTDGVSVYSMCLPITGGNSYNLYAFARDVTTASNTSALTLRLATYTSAANCSSKSTPTNYDSVANGTVTNAYAQYGGTVTPAATQFWGRVFVIFDTPNVAEAFYADSVRLTVSSLAAGVDLAESFPIEDGYIVEPGDIVSVSSTNSDSGIKYIKKSSGEFDTNIVGIVSTKPGITLDDGNTYTKAKVALAGRVPVKISSLSEAIKAGDYITSSSEEGKAMKASRTGQVIGKALNDWDPLNPTEKIIVLIDNSYYYHRDVEFAAFTDRLNALQNSVDGQTENLNTTNQLLNTTLNSNSTSTTGPTLSGGFEGLDLTKLTGLLTKFTIDTDGSLTFNSKINYTDQLSVENFVTKKISSESSDILIELNDTLNKNKLLVANKAGVELFSIDYKGNARFSRDVTINGDLYVDGKVAGKSVFESKWVEISPNSEESILHNLGVIPRSINILRATESDCESKNGELECTNVTNEGFGNKEMYYYKNLDKSSLKVVNALSDKIFVKVFVTK